MKREKVLEAREMLIERRVKGRLTLNSRGFTKPPRSPRNKSYAHQITQAGIDIINRSLISIESARLMTKD